MPSHVLTVRSLRARALSLPMTRPIQTGGGSVAKVPLVLVDLVKAEGLVASDAMALGHELLDER